MFHARLLHVTSLHPAAGWMYQQTSPCCPICPLSSCAVTVISSVSCLCNMPVQSTAPGKALSTGCWDVVLACAAANLLFSFWIFLVAFWQSPCKWQCPWTAFCQGPWGHQPHYSGAEVPRSLAALERSLLRAAGDTRTAKPPGVHVLQRETPRTHSVTMKLSYSFIQ